MLKKSNDLNVTTRNSSGSVTRTKNITSELNIGSSMESQMYIIWVPNDQTSVILDLELESPEATFESKEVQIDPNNKLKATLEINDLEVGVIKQVNVIVKAGEEEVTYAIIVIRDGTDIPEWWRQVESETANTEEVKKEWEETGNIGEQRDGVPIPYGYRYVGRTKDTGLTIQDIDNEKLVFIWVPVDDTTVGNITNAKTALAEIYTTNDRWIVGGIDSNTEYLNNTFKENIDPKVKASIDFYGGFYVSQAGLGYEVDENGRVSNPYSNIARGMVNDYAAEGDYYRGLTKKETVKKVDENGQKKEIRLTYHNMLDLASQIGKENITSSHMTYGAQWDAIMVWLMKTRYQEETLKVIADSNDIGKYINTIASHVGTSIRSNNIWGLAGNLAELTQEYNINGSYVLRGGAYNYNGNVYPMASRMSLTQDELYGDGIGFRACLCIDVE